MLEKGRVSIIIVSYNTRDMTVACLQSIRDQVQGVDFEVLVGDNGSADGSLEAIDGFCNGDPRFRRVDFGQNLGFALANNRLVECASGEWVLLLNPDTELRDDAVSILVSFAESYPSRGIFGGRTIYADGSLNPTSCWGPYSIWSTACRSFGLTHLLPGSRIFNPRSYPGWDRRGIRTVGMVTGCFFLLRREDWDRLGGFDPDFFVYGEEADLCWRARRAGLACVINGEAQIVHHGSQSEQTDYGKALKIYDGEIRLLYRHWKGWRFSLAKSMIVVSVGMRALAEQLLLRQGGDKWRRLWTNRSVWLAGASGIRTRGADELDR